MIHVKRGKAPAAFDSRAMKEERRLAAEFYHPEGKPPPKGTYKFKPPTDFFGLDDAIIKLFRKKCAYCETVVLKAKYVPDPYFLKDLPGSTGDRFGPVSRRPRLGDFGRTHTAKHPRLMYAGLTGFYELDYFRPVGGAVGLDGVLSLQHYWWLAYDWFNLYLACSDCSKLKGNKFPVEGQRAAQHATRAQLRKEKALLLDPCADRPEEHLVFHESGQVTSETEQGRTTIDVLGLNRANLIKARAKVVKDLAEFRLMTSFGASAAEARASVKAREFYGPEMSHLAVRRQFLQQWSAEAVRLEPGMAPFLKEFLSFRTALNLAEEEKPAAAPARKKPVEVAEKLAQLVELKREGLINEEITQEYQHKILENYLSFKSEQDSYSVEKGTRKQKRAYFGQTRFIERVVIHNFKVIADLELTFPPLRPDEGSWLMLLGENGTGKSTILEAVALALMGERARREAKFRARDCLRYGAEAGHVKVFLTGSLDAIELHFRKGSNLFESRPDAEPKILLLGYGATRLLPRHKHRPVAATGASKTQNLFDPFIPLSDATSWLYALPKKVFDQIEDGLKQLLLLGEGDRFIKRRATRRIDIEAFGAPTPLEDLSDGYQSVLALAADIMGVMRLRWKETPLSFVEGIVLVDEVDAHLHPRWKMRIVERLRKVFPRLQFLVTSHDPLCLRGLHEGEVVVMRRDAAHRPVAVRQLPAPDALRIDQILTSDYFGLNTTIDPETEELFEEYYGLLALRRPTAAQKERIRELQGRLKGLELMGTTPRERLVLEAADKYLAKRQSVTDEGERLRLSEEAKEKIARMWESLG